MIYLSAYLSTPHLSTPIPPYSSLPTPLSGIPCSTSLMHFQLSRNN